MNRYQPRPDDPCYDVEPLRKRLLPPKGWGFEDCSGYRVWQREKLRKALHQARKDGYP